MKIEKDGKKTTWTVEKKEKPLNKGLHKKEVEKPAKKNQEVDNG